MSIRRTIILLTVPLFIALAIVNGALLYFQEKAEMSQAMGEQALAAAITSAEFVSSMERPLAELADPLRGKALAAAARHVTGMDGLYLAIPGAQAQALIPASRGWSLEGLARPQEARVLPLAADKGGHRYVVALAPAAAGAFVAARIDAEPMFARMAAIRNAVLAIVVVAALTATGLAWFVARRIVRELDKNRLAIAAIGADQPLPGDDDLTIREARDLADAVRLMDASRQAAAERNRRVSARKDHDRTPESALAASRDTLFAPVNRDAAGAQVALRMYGEAPLGSFFALCSDSERAFVVLGRCPGATPKDALARAVDARRFLEANLLVMDSEACLALARSAYEIEEMRIAQWTASGPLPDDARLLALADAATAQRAGNYAARNGDAAPAAIFDGIELLVELDGIFAAVGRT